MVPEWKRLRVGDELDTALADALGYRVEPNEQWAPSICLHQAIEAVEALYLSYTIAPIDDEYEATVWDYDDIIACGRRFCTLGRTEAEAVARSLYRLLNFEGCT